MRVLIGTMMMGLIYLVLGDNRVDMNCEDCEGHACMTARGGGFKEHTYENKKISGCR
jgi:hypothetical protein